MKNYSRECIGCVHEKCPTPEACGCPCHTLSSLDPNRRRVERPFAMLKPEPLKEN